jgi:hypothetical protein
MRLLADPSDEAILAHVDAWVDLLAAGDFASAYALTDHDYYYQWSPELLRQVIAGYGSPDSHPSGNAFAVSPRNSATGGPPRRVVIREVAPPGSLAFVEYDLPLNGAWSDLTATFRVERRQGAFALILEEVYVH